MQRCVTESHYLESNDDQKDLIKTLKNKKVYVVENGASRVVGNVVQVGVDAAIQALLVHMEVDGDIARRFKAGEIKGLPPNAYVLAGKSEPKTARWVVSVVLFFLGVCAGRVGF